MVKSTDPEAKLPGFESRHFQFPHLTGSSHSTSTSSLHVSPASLPYHLILPVQFLPHLFPDLCSLLQACFPFDWVASGSLTHCLFFPAASPCAQESVPAS